jgi:rhodanese-related sulfurtransferase
MRKGLLLTVAAMLLLLPPAGALGAEKEVKYINAAALKAMLGDPQLTIIDVRTPKDWNDSKNMIKGALRQDPGKVPTWAQTLSKDKKLVVYCA